MFGFPVNLQDSGVQKFTNDADNGFPKIQQREVFYSVRNGQWFDRGTWQTASGRVGLLPTRNDDVYVRHNVDIDYGFVNFTITLIEVNNIIVSTNGKLLNGPSSGYGFRVYGDFKYYGVYDSVTTGNWDFWGLNNYIDKSRQVTKIYVNYSRFGDQNMMDALYGNISAVGSGFKYSTSDMIVDNMFSNTNAACFYIRNPHSLICNGTYNCFLFYSDTEYNLTFKNSVNSLYAFFCSRNPTIEFQNNITLARGNYAGTIIDKIPFTNAQLVLPFPYGAGQSMYLGTGVVKFTTNNIQINNTADIFYDNTFVIDPNIVVTNNSSHTMVLNNTINGSNSTSQLINKGTINFNSLASISSMTTGIFDYTTFANTIGFTGNYTATIPSYFTTFHNLTIRGTGTKSLGVNTIINGNLFLLGNQSAPGTEGILECSTFNLRVNGLCAVGGFGAEKGATLSKNGAGSLIFVGAVTTSNSGCRILLNGNPSVEMRGGLDVQFGSSLTSGTGNWTFTTNNQTIGSTALTFLNNISIDGGITITNVSQVSLYGVLDGNNINSKWVLNSILDLFNTTLPFPTLGTLDYTTNTNANIGFRFNGNFTLPITTFQGLRIGGTGIKTLSGNTLVQRNLFLLGNPSSPGTAGILECSTFNLQVNGQCAVGGTGSEKGAKFSKNAAGNLLFIGSFTTSNGGDVIDLTGNPTIELRGGGNFESGGNFGNGLLTISTNNQSIFYGTFNQNILISGPIILNIFYVTMNGSINGDNASSTLRQITNSVVTYRNATQPMITGILDTSTNLNTWIYGSGNQDIKGGPTTGAKQVYRNLTLNGGGTKTLQGYVSVQNTYTLTSPATLNNNGFTLTNP